MSKYPAIKLGTVLHRSEEIIIPKANVEYSEITVRLWGNGVLERGRVLGTTLSGRRFVARAGQFIVSRIDARNGAMGLVPQSLEGSLVTNDFPLFNLDTKQIEPAFLGWLCRTADFVELCRRASEGTTNRIRLKEERFFALDIPLPPLADQRRIVARIEELAAQINEAKDLRKQAKKETEALLTSSRRVFIGENNEHRVTLESVCSAIIDNLHSNPRLSVTGIPCIRSSDVGYGTLNIYNAQRTDEEEFKKRTVRGIPQENDIVFVREGGGTGKCAIVKHGQKFSLGQRVMMIRPNTERIIPKFFLHQLLSPQIQEDQITPLSKGSASPHMNIGAFKKFDLILPTLPKQRRIVAELDAMQAEVDALKRLQAETAAELDALLPAVLDRAFKGEL